jgi:hypothetical protein
MRRTQRTIDPRGCDFQAAADRRLPDNHDPAITHLPIRETQLKDRTPTAIAA